jgi:hypothetical protein
VTNCEKQDSLASFVLDFEMQCQSTFYTLMVDFEMLHISPLFLIAHSKAFEALHGKF